MTRQDDLLRTRFRLNMGRVNAILAPHITASGQGLLQTEGADADVFRLCVVFLHATFEVALRSRLRKPDDTLTFSGGSDLDKALKRSGIDPRPFKSLYPPLIQMARRRIRIVHEADLPNRMATTSEPWTFADTWQLMMWLMAVTAFHNQLLIITGEANVVEKAMFERRRKAMQKHRELGMQVLALPDLPVEHQKAALGALQVTVEEMRALLTPKVSDFTDGEQE